MMSFPKSITMSELETKINSVFFTARLTKCTSDELRNRLNEEIDVPLSAKYPSGKSKHSNYLKGFVQGIITAQRSRIMQEEVEFCYLVDGVLYSTHKQSTHQTTEVFFKEGKGHLLGNYPRNFYWKGTDKPFTASL